MEIWIDRLTATFGGYLPRLLAALAVLVVGWLVALVITALVRAVLRRTTIDNRLAAWLQGDREGKPPEIEGVVGRIIFWLMMAMVLLAFFQVLGLAFVAGPIAGLLDEVFAFMPNLLSAVVLLVVAWMVARILRFLVERGAKAANLDERLARHTGPDPQAVVSTQDGGETPSKAPALSRTLGETVYWLTFLLFLPAVLGALQLTGLLEPVHGLVDKILGFLPNILAAGLILLLGWLGARILQRVVSSLLAAAGVDRFGHSIGVSTEHGGKSLSSVIGLVLYVLVLLPVIVAALNALAIDAVTRPASEMLNRIMLAIPHLFAAGVVLVLAYFIGKVLAGVVSNLLAGIGFDRFLERIGLVSAGAVAEGSSEDSAEAAGIRRAPSQIVGYVVMAGLLLFATIEALSLLEFELMASMVTEFTMFAGNVLLGALIFVVGYYLASLAAGLIRSSSVAQADLLARVAQAAVVVLAAVMALRQAGLAEDVILLAFGLSLGALAVAAAIAFGVGGRDLAARYLERWTGKDGSSKEG